MAMLNHHVPASCFQCESCGVSGPGGIGKSYLIDSDRLTVVVLSNRTDLDAGALALQAAGRQIHQPPVPG